ncbi:hypothetical protein [Paraburkholderia sp. BL23I1N1]|uniref:hypothetical protein n=1 Tax=Paraburkholderia sp. BL23I1N1 TaxID=1938802 RepID=UPI0011C42C2C|nr:hypothetical protein [Paraburkholderia sp. BL23I1N1]
MHKSSLDRRFFALYRPKSAPILDGFTDLRGARRPEDDAPFVSESFGGAVPPGIGLTPLADWLALSQPHLYASEMWAVDPFRLAEKN